MDILSKFKLNAWWKVMLVIGFSLIITILTHDIKILNAKYLFLASCGMVIVGLAMFSAEKYASLFHGPLYLEGYYVDHSISSKILCYVGWIMILVFGFMTFYDMLF